MQHTYEVEGMHCGGCVAKIKSALEATEGVRDVEVSLNPPRAIVEMHRHLEEETLNASVQRAGDYSLHESDHSSGHTAAVNERESYYPLYLIASFILGFTAIEGARAGSFQPGFLMETFMGGFFVVFSFFKLLDLKGFAEAYSTYDIVAKRYYNYGYIYPFIELSLGISYLLGFIPVLTNWITLVVMLVSSIGVIGALLKRRTIQCACLGTVFKLPMTKITLFEDLSMAGMAAVMLVLHG
ncbi:MAG: heavy-metal-associated domain-containing protein [Deltaproteobacteria bacterium]|nr:heavy-metal-associated domain-containing protein [Deltaproteobacteria bacterium]